MFNVALHVVTSASLFAITAAAARNDTDTFSNVIKYDAISAVTQVPVADRLSSLFELLLSPNEGMGALPLHNVHSTQQCADESLLRRFVKRSVGRLTSPPTATTINAINATRSELQQLRALIDSPVDLVAAAGEKGKKKKKVSALIGRAQLR